MRSLTVHGVVVLLASLLTMCGCHGQRVQASLQGERLHYDRVSGRYCEHCSGTQMISVGAEADGTTPLRLRFQFASCKYGHELWISTDGGAELEYGQAERAERAVEGRIHCHSGKKDWVDFSFWGVFANGKRIEGRLSTPLKLDAGYD
jgi:hypothetical protein